MLSRLFRLCPSAPRFHPSLSLPLCRSYTPDPAHLFVQKYNRKKQEHLALVHPTLTEVESFGLTQPNEVCAYTELACFCIVRNTRFINNELNLSYIDVYGFDYDYTLANYTDKLSKTIYQILRDILIDHLRYPAGLRGDLRSEFRRPRTSLWYIYPFESPIFTATYLNALPDFRNGWLMKVDSFSKIQLNTVYVGREPIKNPDQIVQLHNGIHISPHYLNANMNQLNDLFSIPESCLLSDFSPVLPLRRRPHRRAHSVLWYVPRWDWRVAASSRDGECRNVLGTVAEACAVPREPEEGWKEALLADE
ncbi:HAD-like domain-containing protein [Jimgerdemannia flammicorona]|uniref:HAD-like domain-containing protein n=1 Tax=Jimgerdemannia flammicorona TaxID=994334 RepID=A0A433P7H2_9FUNG|nr:HAD-like domain-containing protein [Jimgerdemannia flammicorona]